MHAPHKILATILGVALCAVAASPASAQDSDGDGAIDTVDAYPCDASIAAIAFAPGEGQHAALLFEDQWPQAGDADFNDAVITYNYMVTENGAGEAVAITATFNALALGGNYDNGLGLHLPVPSANIGAVTLTLGTGSPQPIAPSTADSEFTLPVINNMRALFGGQAGPINAIDGATLNSEVIQVDIALSTPTTLDMAAAPFDIYLFRSAIPAHEIHRSGYTGTAAMDTTLFNTNSDNSGPGLAFIDDRGLPFVLNIPQYQVYPKEAVDIATLWPRIVNFAATSGAQDGDFYVGDAVLANAFTGSASPSPSLNATAPVADFSCAAPTGGNQFDFFDGTTMYRVAKFTSSGAFDAGSLTSVDILVVAGGGGGMQNWGAGSGAGGARLVLGQTIAANSVYTVTVGQKGATGIRTACGQGGSSAFGTLINTTGGGCGAYDNSNGFPGGSGGGGSIRGSTPGAGTAGEGYVGSGNRGVWWGGGGGGAGGPGSGKNGGIGIDVSSYFGSANVPNGGLLAGGGGTSAGNGQQGGSGRYGGGNGHGNETGGGTHAIENTGGGAGGSPWTQTNLQAADGLILIRWVKAP